MASLDAARRQLAVHGECCSTDDQGGGARVRRSSDSRLRDRRGGVSGARHRRLGSAADRDRRARHRLTGYEVANALRASYDIYVELATHATVVLVLGLGQPVEPLDRVAHDLGETVRADPRGPAPARSVARRPAEIEDEPAVSPRDAFLGRVEAVPVDDAVGRISPSRSPATRRACRRCYRVSASPPRWSPTCGRWSAGARLHGAADPSFETVRVLVT